MRYLSIIILAMAVYLSAGLYWLRSHPVSPMGDPPLASRSSPYVHALMESVPPSDMDGYRRLMATLNVLGMADESRAVSAYAERRAWTRMLGLPEAPASSVAAAVAAKADGHPPLDALRRDVMAKTLRIAIDETAQAPGYMPQKETMQAVAPGVWSSYYDRQGVRSYEYRLRVLAINISDTPLGRMHIRLALTGNPKQVFDCADGDSGQPAVTPGGASRSLWCALDTSAAAAPAVDPDVMRSLLGEGFTFLPQGTMEFPALGLQMPGAPFPFATLVLRRPSEDASGYDDGRQATAAILAQGCRALDTCGARWFPVKTFRAVLASWYIAVLVVAILAGMARSPLALIGAGLILLASFHFLPASSLLQRGMIDVTSLADLPFCLVAGVALAVMAWRLPVGTGRAFAVAAVTSASAIGLGFLALVALVIYALTHYAG